MSKIDLFLGFIMVVGAFRGYRRGFLVELFTVIALIAGIFGAFALAEEGVQFLQRQFDWGETALPYISFALLFLAILIGVVLLGRLLKATIQHTFLGTTDAIVGMMLGAFKALFIISVLFWVLSSFHVEPGSGWTEGSYLYIFTVHLAPNLAHWMAGFLPFLKEIF